MGLECAVDRACEGGRTTVSGRAVFTDIHPGGAGIVDMASVPASCAQKSEMSSEMSAEEKVLEFLFFDLTNCFTPILSGKNAPTTWPP
jgi:hypothetical protein